MEVEFSGRQENVIRRIDGHSGRCGKMKCEGRRALGGGSRG